MHRCFILCLFLVALSGSCANPNWRSFATPIRSLASTEADSRSISTDEEEDETPLQSELVPLPTLKDDSRSLFGRPKPCFDVISLKSKPKRTKRQDRAGGATKKRHARPCGSRFSFSQPSPERLTRWFAPAAEERLPTQRKKGDTLFNHGA